MSKIAQTPVMLRRMAQTFEERNAVYADTTQQAANVLAALWPEGVPPDVLRNPAFHLLVIKCVKLARFVNTGLTHEDSILDDGVYSAMIHSIIQPGEDDEIIQS